MNRFILTYAIASLVAIVAAALAIFIIYRTAVIGGISAITESSSEVAARFALNPIRESVAEYLELAAKGSDPRDVAMPRELHEAIAELMRDTHVAKIKIYDRRGIVVFSTDSPQIGNNQADNPGFIAAIGGKQSVKLVYRDTFNYFDKVTEDDNLVQTYFPIRERPTDPVLGVFELYANVDGLVIDAERSEFEALIATGLVLLLLYGGLVLLVRRSGKLVEAQQQTIREKNALLERLSRESLVREEADRKKFATELHEGLAQTLSAVKLAIERARGIATIGSAAALAEVIPDLQNAIGQARTIAMDLRPPSLDDLGLRVTLDALCRQFQDDNPGATVALVVVPHEAKVPRPLKIVIYRIAESALSLAERCRGRNHIRIVLQLSGRAVTLAIGDQAKSIAGEMTVGAEAEDRHNGFEAIRERAIMSGGRLAVIEDEQGWPTLRATWFL